MSRGLVLHARLVTGTGGGPDKTILNSTRYLERAGYQSLCVYMRPPGDPGFATLEERARQLGTPLLAVDDHGPLDWRLPARLRLICRQHRPAIWHGHDYKSNLMGLLVRRSVPMALVTTVHGWVKHTARTPVYYAVDRRCLPRYDRIICVSRDLRERCGEIGVDADRCHLVLNAIDTEVFRRRQTIAEAKKSAGVAPERFLIGAVGRLSAEKGLDRLIGALQPLLQHGIDCELWIAGEGDQQGQLTRLVRELGFEDRVRLLGFRADCRELYEALDAYALASLREGLPNSLLEAMAYEVPVLATRVGGVPGLIRDGENGLLIDPGSTEALSQGLERLAREAELRRRLSTAARLTIEHSFSFADRMEKIVEIYELAVAGAEVAA